MKKNETIMFILTKVFLAMVNRLPTYWAIGNLSSNTAVFG